jgi:hypothetical protein
MPDPIRTGLFCLLRDIGDAVFWLLIAAAGVVALSPWTGVSIAYTTIRARRAQRLRAIMIQAAHGEVWARQLLRNNATSDPACVALARMWLASAEWSLFTKRVAAPRR